MLVLGSLPPRQLFFILNPPSFIKFSSLFSVKQWKYLWTRIFPSEFFQGTKTSKKSNLDFPTNFKKAYLKNNFQPFFLLQKSQTLKIKSPSVFKTLFASFRYRSWKSFEGILCKTEIE